MVRRSSYLKYLALAIAFVGLFIEICLLAEVSGSTKDIAKLDVEIARVNAEIDNLELSLAQQTNLARVQQRAEALGMDWPNDDQIRVISLPAEYAAGNAHTAEIAGAQ